MGIERFGRNTKAIRRAVRWQRRVDVISGFGRRELWQKEADYDLEHRSEYYEKYGEDEFESRLEADIVRLFESRA